MTKEYTILKTVQGSRDGLTVDTFKKGERYELGNDLAEQFYHQGAVEMTGHPANTRQTKVTGPDETKEGEAGVPLDTQNIEELVALARDTYGLDVDTTTGEAAIRELILEAQGEHPEHEDAAKKPKKRKR